MKVTRRRFLTGVGATGFAIAGDAFGFEAHRVLLTRHEVSIPGLPSGLDGVRLAQVSDVHFPGNRTAAGAALEHLHHERPDIVLLTGDMTESQEAMAQVRNFAGEARGRLASVALLGNWEHRVGAVGSLAQGTYRSAGVDLLVNRALDVDVGGARLTLVGLDDPVEGAPDVQSRAEKRGSRFHGDLAGARSGLSGATACWHAGSAGVASGRAHARRADPDSAASASEASWCGTVRRRLVLRHLCTALRVAWRWHHWYPSAISVSRRATDFYASLRLKSSRDLPGGRSPHPARLNGSAENSECPQADSHPV